ncbi:plexin domain-containing protein 2 [Takifugu rubripes]|uniref:plexin domain-containing protein 2 n=1 Tax=Takifugu rubripes TaxID=31033 RepID=UPI001145334F|nr:plexin domain-containing protein 2-like [Takifugu rubripes]
MVVTLKKTVNIFTGLALLFQFHLNCMKLKSAYGVYLTDSQELSSPEGPSNVGHKPIEKARWPLRNRSEAPRGPAHKRGPDKEQHHPEEQKTNHIPTQTVDIDHTYYTSKIYGPGDAASKELWVKRDDMWKVCSFLSSSYRQTERVTLSFEFPFYGHILKEVTVAAGGFIYTGDVIHQMLTATQYIAPLMANFDLHLSENSNVLYSDNGTALVVQWNRVVLHDNIRVGTFTFQAVLHSDGRIVFAYKQIPVDIAVINTEMHPVKVGLADAFVVLHELEQIPDVRRRTIFEYHKVDIIKSRICNYTVVEMVPLPTCLQFTSCGPCVTAQIGFNCSWCSRLQRCSSGIDRNRQDWVDLGCLEEKRDPLCLRTADVTNAASRHLGLTTPSVTPTATQQRTSSLASTPFSKASAHTRLWTHSSTEGRVIATLRPPAGRTADDGTKMSLHSNETSEEQAAGQRNKRHPFGLLAGIVMVTVIVMVAFFTSVYIYNHPTSSISLFFIERRPNRWPVLKFRRRGDCSTYTDVESLSQDRDTMVIIDPKQSFVMSDRRESEQKEGFIVPDQRERFLVADAI